MEGDAEGGRVYAELMEEVQRYEKGERPVAPIIEAPPPASISPTTPSPPTKPVRTTATFSSLPPTFTSYLRSTLSSTTLTPIQSLTYAGRTTRAAVSSHPPFLVHAPTGSGKTLAYLLPLLAGLVVYEGGPLKVSCV